MSSTQSNKTIIIQWNKEHFVDDFVKKRLKIWAFLTKLVRFYENGDSKDIKEFCKNKCIENFIERQESISKPNKTTQTQANKETIE